MEKRKIYICNKDFHNLGLEIGDYFPAERFTQKAIEDAVKQKIIIEQLETNPPPHRDKDGKEI